MRQHALVKVFGLFLVLSLGLISFVNADKRIYTGFLSNKAVGGYDSVAYFSDSKAVKGISNFSTEYQGATWYFSNQKNLNKFLSAPEKFAPQYGGYCAWAVSQGNTAKGDPLIWTVHKEKLYLNYNKSINQKWLKDKEFLIIQANKNWPGVID